MPSDNSMEKLTVDQAVMRVLKRHFDESSNVGFVLVLVHALMLSPVLLPVSIFAKLPLWINAIVSALIYLFLVMPLRYWGREKIRRLFYSRNTISRNTQPYKRWMHAGLLRLSRALLWGAPFLAGVLYLLIGKSKLPYTEMWAPFRPLAVLVGKEPDTFTGMLVGLVILALLGLLFAYGWWRDMPFEYLPVRSLGRKHTLHWSRRIMKHHRKEVVKVTLVNILLCLPAVIGYAAVLIPYVKSQVDFSLSNDLVLNMIMRVFKNPLPTTQILLLIAVTAALYLPLCGVRKMRNAALIAKIMRQNRPHHHHSHAEGDSAQAPETGDTETHAAG